MRPSLLHTALAGAAALTGLALAGCALTRAGYESPFYTVESRDGGFELRRYADMVLATTPMAGGPESRDDSFMRLFRYIGGANQSGEKIAMTTPVLSTPGSGSPTMSFITPAETVASGVPSATSDQIRSERLPGGVFAAYRFGGSWEQGKVDSAREDLLAWVTARGLRPVGAPLVANYDPPFTPPIFRRNEVLVRVERP